MIKAWTQAHGQSYCTDLFYFSVCLFRLEAKVPKRQQSSGINEIICRIKLGRGTPRTVPSPLHASAWLYYMAPPPPDIREEFKRRGSVTLLSTEAYDSRRMASFAPYFVVPFCFFVVNRAPSEHRIRAWTACLVAFGFCSVIMYNTDTSADGDGPVFVRAREVR